MRNPQMESGFDGMVALLALAEAKQLVLLPPAAFDVPSEGFVGALA